MAARRRRLPGLLDSLISAAPLSTAGEAALARAALRAQHPHHSRLRTLAADALRLPNIARVSRHLDCDLIELRASGEPPCVFLGRDISLRDEEQGARASPQFRTVEALEYFCETHLDAFLSIRTMPRHARHWFWNR